jgi:hypothetical protein
MTSTPESSTTCINTCNDRNNKCTYSDYSTFLNSKTTCRPVNQKTYKSYSSGGFKGSKKSPNSYYNSIPAQFCANYADTTETSPYLRYSDFSKCCKFVCKNIISNTSSSCPPFSSSFTINYDEILTSNGGCPLDSIVPFMIAPIISQGTPTGGVFTISQQPNIPGANPQFTIDSSTGVVTIPGFDGSAGHEQGDYIFTYTVCGYVIQWTAYIGAC